MSRNKVGVPYANPIRYVGPGTDLIPIVKVSRIPTTSDKRFPVGQFWIIGESPTTGVLGDLYYLCNYLAGVPQWCKVSTGAGVIGVDGLTSDDGLPTVVPDGMGNVTIAGGTGITTSGQDPDTTLTIDLDVPVVVSSGGTGATSLTDGGILLGSGTAAVTVTAQMTDGQLLIGRTGIDPIPAILTDGTGITITEGAGTITIAASGGAAIPLSFPTDAGTATPAANALTIAGGTGINTAGAGATATVHLDSPVLVANGGSGRTSHTEYAVICGGTTTTAAQQSIASVGTAGQALLSNGAGALPTFQNVPGGSGITYLGTATATASATLEFTSLIDATYNVYLFIFDNIRVGASDILRMRTSSDAGVSYDSGASNYIGLTNFSGSAGTTSLTILSAVGNGANDSLCGRLMLYNPSNAGEFTYMSSTCGATDSNGLGAVSYGVTGCRKEIAIVDAIQFYFVSNNIASGTIKMYGLTTPA